MRGTFIAGLFILGASGAYIALNHFHQLPSTSHSSSKFAKLSASRKKPTLSKKNKLLHQGEQHESPSHRSRQQVEPDLESIESQEGASSSFEQAQSLPSIYQDKELEPTGSAVNLGEEISTESDENLNEAQKQPVVYGVPVASWLKHAQNQLPHRIDLKQPEGMRLFFNCMEIKKGGTQALSQKECKEIAVSREKSKGAALIQ